VPSDRAEVLRSAFAATLRDPEFQKDADQARLDTDLVTGAELDTVLKNSAAVPQQVIDRLKQALGRN
jgi:tripartite-type tricarboxylate transporter receptor subunit TctC